MKTALLVIAVIAHRGEHLQHVENTLAAFEAAADAGADYFEADVRTTRDGRLVLMHDATVDRTTNGRGRVAELTFAQVRALRAGAGPVPTFEEALEAARRRFLQVYVDAKDAPAGTLLEALARAGMEDRVVVYGGLDYLKQVQARSARVRVMPESVSLEVTQRILSELRPRVIAFSARDWQDGIIRLAREAGVDIFVDRLGPDDNPRAWQEAIDRGAPGMQTDHPGELVRFLRARGQHP